MPSLASVTFDASGFRFHSEGDGTRVWSTPAGDRVGLYYFALKPDLDADLQSVDATRHVCRSRAAAIGAAIIEVSITIVDGCRALRQVIKVPQQPHGMVYLGSLVLPFRDFSFVVKVQCHEWGLTGVRDSVILDEATADGQVTWPDDDREGLHGWMYDPYDPALHDGFHYNLSEASEYDSRFPTHPLTRLRSVLAHLEQSIHVTTEVRHSPAYIFPARGLARALRMAGRLARRVIALGRHGTSSQT